MKNEDYEYNNMDYDSSPYDSDGNNKKPGPAGCVIGIVFLLWFAGSILLSFYLSATEDSWLIPIIVMHIFLVICIIDTVQRLLKKQKPQLMLVIIGIGSIIGMVLTCMYHFNDSEAFRDMFVRLLAVAFLLLFMSIGVYVILKSLLGRDLLRKRCTQPVYGVCKQANEKIKTVNGKTRSVYSLVYEIDLNGETTELQEEIVSTTFHSVGETRKLFINPDNPAEFYDPDEKNDGAKDDILVGAIFVIMPLIMLILTLKYAF